MNTPRGMALRVLANMVDDGLLDGQTYPDQALAIPIHMQTPERVREIAARYGVEVEQWGGQTYAEIGLGAGSLPESRYKRYRSAVVLRVAHVPDPDIEEEAA